MIGSSPRNILLIVLDTLRADYSKKLSRILQNYGFVEYKNTIAPAPWTVPSHASIFTGMYPLEHIGQKEKELQVQQRELKKSCKTKIRDILYL